MSPALRITPTPDRRARVYRLTRPQSVRSMVRSIDGSGNNLDDPAMGAALTPLLRRVPPDYGDRISELAGPDRPRPRAISVMVSAQPHPVHNKRGLSDFFWQWGQFLDHDLDLVGGISPPEPVPIEVPLGDPFFDPDMTGTTEIEFNRSNYHKKTGKSLNKPPRTAERDYLMDRRLQRLRVRSGPRRCAAHGRRYRAAANQRGGPAALQRDGSAQCRRR